MDRRRELINQRKFSHYRNRPRVSENDDSGSSNNIRRNGRPANLRGKAIGLYYAQKSRERSTMPLATVLLSERRKSEITKLLGNTQLKNDVHTKSNQYKHIADSDFKDEFLKIINGSIQDKLNNSVRKTLIPNPNLDQSFYDFLLEQKKTKPYQRMLEFRETLPSFKMYKDIIHLVNNNNVIVVSGETGCGKTTQVPQFILDDYIINKKGSVCKIVCTQPRRISAISVAERVAQERGESCGANSVGYQIRLEKKLPRSVGSITFCTTGVLLKQMETDPYLSDVSHLILDEIHERDITSDFVITLVKDVISKRPDLKLILMSATLNAKQFCNYFNGCKIIEIPGFTFPVQTYYLEDILSKVDFVFPQEQELIGWRKYARNRKSNPKQNQIFQDFIEPYVRNLRAQKKYSRKICDNLLNPKSEELNLDLIFELLKYICVYEPDGSILVFLPGFSDINKLNSLLIKSKCFPEYKYLVILLHSKMASIQQRQIFNSPPPGVRKIVIATNIAETSITIDDIVYVIDCGKIKMKTYDVEKDLELLNPEWVSLANANQRKGRAGRVKPGVCYHLFTKVRQNCLDSYQEPEIKRSRLENIILTVKILQLGKAQEFFDKLMDSPHPKAVENSIRLLKHMNALDAEEKLTPLGYHLAKLPVNPRMGKMILLGSLFSCLDPIASIAASLDFKDAFYTPVDKQKEVDFKKRELVSNGKSDHLLLAEALKQYESAKSFGEEKDFCWQYFLNSYTLELLRNMKRQFADYLNDMKFLTNADVQNDLWNLNSKNSSLVKAIVCASLYPNVAVVRKCNRKFKVIKTIENESVKIHMGSVNCHQDVFESPILVYHLKLKSTDTFLHDTTMIHPLPLLFFGDEIKIEDDNEDTIISLSNYLRFKCKRDTALLIIELRKYMDNLLEHKISHPGIVDWKENASEGSVLRAIIELITSEDIGDVS